MLTGRPSTSTVISEARFGLAWKRAAAVLRLLFLLLCRNADRNMLCELQDVGV